MQLGRYEIRLSKIYKSVMHSFQHFAYNINHMDQVLPPTFSSALFLCIKTNLSEESEFNRRHGEKFPEGSYEIIRRRDSKPNAI